MTITKLAPLCACGCGNPVTRSKKRPTEWNRYYSRHGRERAALALITPPKCRCGCGASTSWQPHGSRWRVYADGCLPDPRDLKACITKRALQDTLGVHERTIERMVQRGDLPEPVLVKRRANGYTALEVRFLLAELPGWVRRQLRSRR